VSDPELALDVRAVTFRYETPAWAGERTPGPVLSRVSLGVRAGERLGILGPNGGGKSTLLKLVLGLLKPDEGEIRVFGLAPSRARRDGLVGYLPQRIDASRAWPISVRQAVGMGATVGASPMARTPASVWAGVDRAIDLVGLGDLRESPVGRLSGGQMQLTMIARAVARGPKLLVLDEPTVGVDVTGQRRFASLIRRLHDELNLTVITVSHELATIAASSDRVACLRQTLHYHDTPEGLTPRVLAEVFSHDVEAVFGSVHVDAHTAAECPDPAHVDPHGHHEHGPGCAHDHTHPHGDPHDPPRDNKGGPA